MTILTEPIVLGKIILHHNVKQGDNDPSSSLISRVMAMFNSKVICLLISFFYGLAFQALATEEHGFFPNKPLTIAISSESYPYHFIDESGKPAGIMVEYWLLWAKIQNVEVKFVTYNWLDSLNAIENGDVDIHAGMAALGARKQRFDFSVPIYFHQNYIYLQRDMNRLNDIKELTPYTVGAVEGGNHVAVLAEQNPRIQIREFNHRYEMFDAALNNEIIAFASGDTLEKGYQGISELNELFPKYQRFKYYEGHYAAGFDKKQPLLRQFVDQGIAKIGTEQRNALYEKWTYERRNSDNLTLIFPTDLPPFMALSPMGSPQGLFVDIWKLWSETTGVQVEFVPDTMSGSVQQIKNHQADVILAYPEQSPSKTGLAISAHVYGTQAQIFISKKAGNIHSIEGLFGKNVGLFSTAPYIEEFRRQYPQIKIVEFINHAEMIEAAENGHIDAMISEIENMNVKLVNGNLQSSFYRLPTPVFKIDLFSLVNPGNPQLAKIVSEGFNLLPIDKLQKIEKNWLSLPEHGFFSDQAKKLDLTSEEYGLIVQQKIFTVGMVADWEPIEFKNAKGEPDGANKDFLLALANRAGLKLDFKLFSSYDSLLEAFNKRDVDIVAGLSESDKSKAMFSFSDNYWKVHWAILHNRVIEPQQNINYFYGKDLALIKGYHLIPKIREAHPQINITIVENVEQGLLALQQGLVDGFVEMLPVLSKLAKRENITPMAISVVEELPLEPNKIGVHKPNELLLSILNKSLKALDEQQRQQILDKWFDVKVQTGLEKRFVAKVAAQLGALAFIVILIIVVWNRKLRQEITLRKQLESKMKHMASHDELTGLANRMLLKQQMNQAISIHQRQRLKLAVLFIDLDGFKKVNDSYGHEAGDQVLIEVAQRLESCVRQSDTVARFGGDEFVIMITGINNKQESTFIAEKIIKVIGQPFDTGQGTANIGCSIGIALYPDDGQGQSEILNMADNLMYRVKTSGKNDYCLR